MIRTGTMQRAAFRMLLMALVVSFLLSVVPSAALATSTVTFTSTADFDAGTPSAASQNRDWFASNGLIGGPDWIRSSEYANGRTFIAWEGPAASGSTRYASPWITYYDHALLTWAPNVRIADGTLIDEDHGPPNLAISPSGTIHVFYGSHASAQLHAASTNPYDISAWTTKPSITTGTSTGRFTYPEPFYRGTTLYLLIRESSGDDTQTWMDVLSSTNEGTTWSAAQDTVDFGATKGIYMFRSELWADRLWMEWSFISGNRENAYVAYLNLTQNKMFSAAGTDLGTTIDKTEADANCRVEDSETGPTISEANGGVIHLDASGNPYITYTGRLISDSSWVYRFSKWNGASWSTPATITSAKHQENRHDFRIISATNIEAYLVRGGFDAPGRRGGNIERWTWDGATWTQVATVFSETKSRFPANNPAFVRNFDPALKVVFGETGGEFNFDISGTDRSFAYSGTAYVTRPDDLGVSSVETQTDNGGVAAGAFELASGKGDAMGYADADAATFRWHNSRWITPGGTDADFVRSNTAITSPGKMNLRLQTGSLNSDSYGVISSFTFSGDFDVRIKPALTPPADTQSVYFGVFNEDEQALSASTTFDGILYQQYWQTDSRRMFAFTNTNGVYTGAGSTTFFDTPNDISDRWMRMTRVGNTITWYYSLDGSSWTQDETTSFTFAGSLRVSMVLTANGGGRVPSATIDDFTLTSTLGAGGFWTSGSWTSAMQPSPTQDIPDTITVNYTGASANAYIDAIAIVDASGNVIYQDGTNRIGGTSATVSIPRSSGNLHQTWSVRVSLAGDGSSSPTITDVSVAFAPDTGCLVNTVGGNLLFTVFPIVVGLGIVLSIAGVYLVQKEHIEPQQFIIAMVGLIVLVLAIAVIFPPLFAVSTACG